MRSLLKRFLGPVLRPWRAKWSAARILSRDFGHGRSVRQGEPVDGEGREIPWFTYPAIAHLDQWDLRDKTVFEFGAGNSTLYWCRQGAQVVSVESNRDWYERVRSRLPAGAELFYETEPANYVQRLAARPESFDVIVIDGIERRAGCRAALAKLRPGGVVILDNSDWHCHCAAVLRAGGLLEVDFAGFGPINSYTWTTSLFFHRDHAFPHKEAHQPVHGIGALLEREPDNG